MTSTRKNLSDLLAPTNKMTIKPEEVQQFEEPLRNISQRQAETYKSLPADAAKKMDDTVRKSTYVYKYEKSAPVEQPKKPDEKSKSVDSKTKSP